MAHIDIISRASKKVLSAVEGVRADITHLSPNGDAVVVKLNIGNDTIVDIKQEGSQLLVVLSNGEVIIIDGYFSQMCESESTRGRGEAAGDNTNHLAVEDAVGNLYFISTVSKNQCLAEVQYYSIESIDPLLSQTEVDVAGWKPWFGYGSVITAAVIGLSQGDNGKSSPPSAPAPTIRIDSPVFRDKNGNDVTKGTDIANGKIAASVHIFGHVDNIADGTKIRVTISPKDLARLGLDSKASTVVCETVVQNGKWELHLDINGKEIDVGMFRQGLDTMQIVAMALNDNGKVLAEHKKSAGLITRLPANGLDVPDYEMTVPANPHDPLNGKGTPGHKITVTFPDGNTATATVDKNGNWSVENPGNLPNGSHVVVNQTNPSGEIGQINGQDPIVGKGDAGNIIIVKMPDGSTSSVVVDKNGNWRIPNPGNFKDGDKISIIAEDDYGNSTTKEAKVPDATAPDVPHVNHPINGQDPITGKGEPDAKVTVELPNGSTVTTTVDKDGKWSVPNPGNFEDGDKIVVDQEDKAGNNSSKTTETVEDATPPAPPKVDLPLNGQDPITGKGEPDAKVTVELPNGSTATTTVDKDGKWSVPNPGNFEDGDKIVVDQEDKAGNNSSKTTETVEDATPPAPPKVDLPLNGQDPITGKGEPDAKVTVELPNGSTATTTVDKDGKWSVPNPGDFEDGDRIVVGQEDKAGNDSPKTTETVEDATPPAPPKVDLPLNGQDPITGKGEPDAKVTVELPNGSTVTTTVDKDGKWSVPNPGNFEDGDKIVVDQEDKAGNNSSKTTETVEDATPPAPPKVDLPLNGQDPITGKGEPDAKVTVELPNGSTATTTVDKDGKWSVPNPGNFEDGDKIVVDQEDKAGNNSSKTTETVEDATPPAPPKVDLPLNGQDPITGKGEPDAKVTVELPNGSTATTTVDKDGKWSVPNPGDFEDGDKIVVGQEDKAGNDSPKTTETVKDATPPVIEFDKPIAGDNVFNKTEATGSAVISGTTDAEDGQKVTVKISDGISVVLANATVKGGKWQISNVNISGLHESKLTLTADVKDAAGNSAKQATANADMDTSAPSKPLDLVDYKDDIAPVTDDHSTAPSTNDARPGFNIGKGLNDTPTLYQKDSSGAWVKIDSDYDASAGTLTPKADLADGDYVFSYTLTDAAGNESVHSNDFGLNIDNTAPVQGVSIVKALDNVTPKTGDLNSGDYTNDTTPELIGTLTSALQAGEYLKIYRDGSEIGTAAVTGTQWRYTDSTGSLKDGSAYEYTAKVFDAAGNSGGTSNKFVLNIDTSAPNMTVSINFIHDDVGTPADYGSGHIIDDSTPLLKGTVGTVLAANEVVAVYRKDGSGAEVRIGEAKVTGTGWTYQDSGLADNTDFTYRARVEDSAGQNSGWSNDFTVTLQTGGSTNTAVIDKIEDDYAPQPNGTAGTVQVAHNGWTNDKTPTLSGSLSNPLATGETLHLYRTDSKGIVTDLGAVSSVSGTGWTHTDSLSTDGAYTYTVAVVSGAGNAGAHSSAWTINLDTGVPAHTVKIDDVQDNKDPGQGSIANGSVTNDDTPTLSGSLSQTLSGTEKIFLYRKDNGGAWVKIAELENGISVNGLNWTYEDSGLGSGSSYEYKAQVEDAAGNRSAESNSWGFDVNFSGASQGISIRIVKDDTLPQTGDVANNGHTNDLEPELQGSITTALQAGEYIRIYRSENGGAKVDLGTFTLAAGATAWSYTDKSGSLTDGKSYTYTAHVVGANQVEGAASNPYTINIDTTVPTQQVTIVNYSDDQIAQTGDFGFNVPTNDTTPRINGTTNAALSAGEYVQIYRDNVKVGTAVVSGTDWHYDDSGLQDGKSYTYTARVIDAAGNEGAVSAPQTLNVDTSAPNITNTTFTVDSVAGDDVVNTAEGASSAVAITGKLINVPADAAAVVTVWVNNVSYIATVQGTDWHVDVAGNDLLADADHKAEAEVVFTDLAGNIAAKQADRAYSAQITLPTITITTPIAGDGYINAAEAPAFDISGVVSDVQDGRVVNVVIKDLSNGQQVYQGTATVAAGKWTVSGVNLSGVNKTDLQIDANVTDQAGNPAADSANVKLDGVIPTASVELTAITDDTGAADFITSDNTLIFNGINSALEADEKIQISLDKGVTWHDVSMTGAATWTFDHQTVQLPDGVNTVQLQVIDAAGNKGAVVSKDVTIVSGSPNVTVDITTLTPDSGVQGDWITNAADISIGGTLSRALNAAAGEKLLLQRDNGTVIDITQFVNGTDWNYADAALTSGSHDYKLWVEDNAANKGSEANQSVTIDMSAPTAALDITEISEDTGIAGDFKTQDDTLIFKGTVGVLDADDKVQVSWDNGQTWHNAVVNAAAGTWLYDNTNVSLAVGTYNLQAQLVDAAGNIGTTTNRQIVIQSATPPVGVTSTFLIDVDTTHGLPASGSGDSNTRTGVDNDLITRDATPNSISGKLNRALLAGEILQISKDSGKTWQDLAVSNGVDWQYTDTQPAFTTDAETAYDMQVTDAVGSVHSMISRTVKVDLTAPNGINTAPIVPQQTVTGQSFNFSDVQYGKVEAGTKVALIDDVNANNMYQEGLDKVLAWATADADGKWNITGLQLAGGNHSLAFLVFDEAGNISSASPFTNTGTSTSQTGAEEKLLSWGGTTATAVKNGLGLNAAAATIDVNGNWSFFQSVGRVRGMPGNGDINGGDDATANAGRVYTVNDPQKDAYSSAYLAQPDNLNDKGYQQYVNSAMFVDLNRDGFIDVMSQISSYDNDGRTAYWMNNGNGTWSAKTVTQGTNNHLGGAVAYDREGDGYLDFVLADSAADSISFMKNRGGVLGYEDNVVNGSGTSTENGRPPFGNYTIQNGLGTGSVTGITPPNNLSVMHEIGTADLDNNGTIDILAHTDMIANGSINNNQPRNGNQRSMGIFYNTGNQTQGFTYVNKPNVFDGDPTHDSGKLSQSVTMGDFNGDGWLDVYLNRGSRGGKSSAESRIYLNDGTGKLNAADAQALWFGDNTSGGTSFAVDWNFDGKIDVIEVPRQHTDGAENLVTLPGTDINKAPMLYLNDGSGRWGQSAAAKNTIQLAKVNNNITGAVVVDYNWDGSLDLILYQHNNNSRLNSGWDNTARSIIVKNANIAADGTAMHVRIVDGFGINTFYGNTVKLYDSHGACVATQLINPQSSGSSNSMGLVSFYGLDPTETYSVQMLNSVNGAAKHVGSTAAQGGYRNGVINTNWGDLKTTLSSDAYVLTAESMTSANNAGTASGSASNPFKTGISGTGYNDHFFGTLGNDYYNGGGGWEIDKTGQKVWSQTGGQDVLDYSRLTGWKTVIDTGAGVVAKSKAGQNSYVDFFVNIEKIIGSGDSDTIVGSSKDDVFNGGQGDDVYMLGTGGSDTIAFSVQDKTAADGTAGNGTDEALNFHVGKVGADANADVIDLHHLLSDYGDTPGMYRESDGAWQLNVSSQNLRQYVDVSYDANAKFTGVDTNGNPISSGLGATIIGVDLKGTGNFSNVLKLYDVQTDLETLLANNQLVL